jgi:hypothetical protein
MKGSSVLAHSKIILTAGVWYIVSEPQSESIQGITRERKGNK